MKNNADPPLPAREQKQITTQPLPDLVQEYRHLVIPVCVHTSKTTFHGNQFTRQNIMKFLAMKYRKDCIVTGDLEYHIHHNKQSAQAKLIDKPGYWEAISACVKDQKRFVIMRLSIWRFLPDGDTKGHSNFLVYDTKTRAMERFEPQGKNSRLQQFPIDETIRALFDQKMGSTFIQTYFGPLNFCPEFSFQTIQCMENEMVAGDPRGFCVAWTAWYADLRLSNPHIDRTTLVRLAIDRLKNSPESFSTFIRNYSNFLAELAAQDIVNHPDRIGRVLVSKWLGDSEETRNDMRELRETLRHDNNPRKRRRTTDPPPPPNFRDSESQSP